MDLKREISGSLWECVCEAYESANYSHAILDAIHYVTSILRERSGVDGDGAQLAGAALGGDSPRVKLNSLSTQSERDVQKGFEAIVRGIYMGLRNPRSHERNTDSRETAEGIIVFLDYVAGILGASKKAFSSELLLEKLRDPEFVVGSRYAALLVEEIPPGRRGDAIHAVFTERRSLNLNRLEDFIGELLGALTEPQRASYLQTVSEEFRTATEDAAIRSGLQLMLPSMWPRLNEVAALRIENKLLNEIRAGEYEAGRTSQALGTWANSFLGHFSLKMQASAAITLKLDSEKAASRNYVSAYFLGYLPDFIVGHFSISKVIKIIAGKIREGDEQLRSSLISVIDIYPEEWQALLVEELKDLTDASNPGAILLNGEPFLSDPTSD